MFSFEFSNQISLKVFSYTVERYRMRHCQKTDYEKIDYSYFICM